MKTKAAPPQVGHFYHWSRRPTATEARLSGFFVSEIAPAPKIPGRRGKRPIMVHLFYANYLQGTGPDSIRLAKWGRGLWGVREIITPPDTRNTPYTIRPVEGLTQEEEIDNWLIDGNGARNRADRNTRITSSFSRPVNDSLDNYVAFFGPEEGKRVFYALEIVAQDPRVNRAWGQKSYVDEVCARVPRGMGVEFFIQERAARAAKKKKEQKSCYGLF